MKPNICLSIAKMDRAFETMVSVLREHANVDVVGLEGFSLAGYDIFIGKKLSPHILQTADRLKVAFAYKTGVDDFPLEQFREMGIALVNSHSDAKYIAEYAIGLSISLLYRITESDKKLRRGVWRNPRNPYWKSLFDVKIGLLGYGHIGRQIHNFLLKNNIEAYTIDRGKHYENINLVSSLEELCEKSHLIIISLPKTGDTDRLFNKETFRLLKDKYIVNVGRSNCIDQEALYDALVSEQLAGAAIDTWDRKPKDIMVDEMIPFEYPFDKLESIVLSPHQAMQVEEGHGRYVADISNKVLSYILYDELSDEVDLTKGY